MKLENKTRKALIDTGCSVSLITASCINERQVREGSINLQALNSGMTRTDGVISVSSLEVNGVELGSSNFHVIESLPAGFEVIIGFDIISKFGLNIVPSRKAAQDSNNQNSLNGTLLNQADASELEEQIEEKDFTAKFNGEEWIVSWHWKNGAPKFLPIKPNYKVKEEERDAFDKEIKTWISESILIPWDRAEHGEVKNFVPMMSVFQMKGEISKVRPVLDFRSLNEHVASYPADATPSVRKS